MRNECSILVERHQAEKPLGGDRLEFEKKILKCGSG
jgi:hypothetical protein